jgi:transitional endoplasmic reticulum ATPase
MEGMGPKKNVFIIGATNCTEFSTDSAILRPGGLEEFFFVPMPDEDSRLQIFCAILRESSVSKVFLI